MFALWLVLFMDGTSCDAVAVCDEGEPSCIATVVSCEAPVRLSACLNEGSAYTAAEIDAGLALYGELEPIYVLGCSTDMAMGWPADVVFDRDELELAQ
jgi:hypothetical protein